MLLSVKSYLYEAQLKKKNMGLMAILPITVTARSGALTVLARWNTGIVDSNPTQGMDVCVYCVCVAMCR
jgi:hypothetical protein